MEWIHSQNAPLVIIGGQLAALIILSVAVAAMGHSRPFVGAAEMPEVMDAASNTENSETGDGDPEASAGESILPRFRLDP